MGEYDRGPRRLSWDLQHAIVSHQTTEGDGDCTPSSFSWPTDSDERVVIPFELSLNEYNVLASAIDVGSDIAYGEDALRVVWLWLRNFRCEVPMATTQCCGPSITDRLNAQIYNNSTLAGYSATETQYETDSGTLDTIAPNMVPAMSSQDGIDQILCLGYEMMLRAIVNQAKGTLAVSEEAGQDLIEQLGIAMAGLASAGGLALAIGGGAAAIVALIGGPWALLGLAVSGIAVGLYSEFHTLDSSVLNDVEAFNDVLCTMRQNGMGTAPSFTMFNELLSPNFFAPDSNAEKLGDIVQPFLNDLTFFLQFMISMSDLYATDIWSNLPECALCPPDIECEGGEGNNFLSSDALWNPYLGRALYASTGTNRGWGPDVSAPSRISIWRAIAPQPTRMKFNTKGDMGGQIRVYSSTGGVIGTILGATTSYVTEGDGTFTWEIPVMTPAAEILIDAGGSSAMDDDSRIRSICWNYDL
jgi:hypothetical protein